MSTNIGNETKFGTTAHKETFLDRLAHTMGTTAHASTIFGQPVERDGVTVIPVGKVRWGFGGGASVEEDRAEEGSGGGSGLIVSPVGYIMLKDGKPRYRPIFDLSMILPLVISSGIVAAIVLRGVRRLIR